MRKPTDPEFIAALARMDKKAEEVCAKIPMSQRAIVSQAEVDLYLARKIVEKYYSSESMCRRCIPPVPVKDLPHG